MGRIRPVRGHRCSGSPASGLCRGAVLSHFCFSCDRKAMSFAFAAHLGDGTDMAAAVACHEMGHWVSAPFSRCWRILARCRRRFRCAGRAGSTGKRWPEAGRCQRQHRAGCDLGNPWAPVHPAHNGFRFAAWRALWLCQQILSRVRKCPSGRPWLKTRTTARTGSAGRMVLRGAPWDANPSS
jgi:hypothetical protein